MSVDSVLPLTADAEEIKFVPPVPETMDDLGLSQSMVEQMILKTLYFRGDSSGRLLASSMGLNFSVIGPLIEAMKRQHLLMAKSSLGIGDISSTFALTEAARELTREYMESNSYVGRIPVPLEQYTVGVKMQRNRADWLSKDMLTNAFKHMVVNEATMSHLGPAVNAGKSFLIYGQPGNGKTYLAEGLFNIESDPIYVPFAIEYQGQIIQLFDPNYHTRLDEDNFEVSAFHRDLDFDGRWFRCKRPFIMSGGELALEMLDLSFNPASKIYDAPFQLKANNGIYLIDDFGRQKVTPAEVLNRWIVPMERRIDFLTFRTGGKAQVPFECFLVFSTNLRPEQLGDEAFLRRIQYKMFVRSPEVTEFIKIFKRFCESQKIECDDPTIEEYIDKKYMRSGKRFRRCQARDVITHAIDLIRFERKPYKLTFDVLSHAFDMTFISEEYET
ncbi:ATP-binding protein [Paludibaculum fermentans]|uniref:ATP-binding protein n=1 Tax=Paludibaculum fermentans TaxID=1473598 RepID=A0A7S7NPL2_PALFE|nr:ATP-binding protein [Paludibaculum fermentans]QOY87448.1 ATP-binding protein [Paludibaculum fermentans]